MAKLKTAAKNASKTEATATTKKTSANAKAEELKNNTAAVIANKALTEVKYNYPADCLTPAQRKLFRTSIRGKIKTYEKKMAALVDANDKESKALLKELIGQYNEIAGKIRKDLKPLKA